MENTKPLLVGQEGGVKTITFNHPGTKNAISEEMLLLFQEEVEKTATDDSRVVVLAGAGGNFSTGASLDTQNLDEFDVTAYLRAHVNPVVLGIRQCPKPFIAQVSGMCVGVGMNYALACDMVYASQTATFSPIFTRIGLSSDGGGSFTLQQRVGYQKAFELMATGAMINAEEALRLGLANHCLPQESLGEAVRHMAAQLANGPYIAIQQTKKNLVEGGRGTLASTLDAEAVNQAANFKSQDFMEGVRAFMEKRAPKFTGH